MGAAAFKPVKSKPFSVCFDVAPSTRLLNLKKNTSMDGPLPNTVLNKPWLSSIQVQIRIKTTSIYSTLMLAMQCSFSKEVYNGPVG